MMISDGNYAGDDAFLKYKLIDINPIRLVLLLIHLTTPSRRAADTG